MKYRAVLTLSMTAACFIFLGPNLAQARSMTSATTSTSTNTVLSHPGKREARLMVPARADLVKSIDARKIRAGQPFEAKLIKTVHLKNGPELPGGTELIGKVVTDRMSNDGKTSRLALRFTRAQLKSGKVVPIKATIVGLYPPVNYYSSYLNVGMPNYWTPKTLQIDELNALHGVSLHSKIASRNSGVFVSKKKDNMRISEDSQFELAIAKRGTSRQSTISHMKVRGKKSGA